jgi:hypothetical protein
MYRLIALLPVLFALTATAEAADVAIVHHESPEAWRFETAPAGGGRLDFTAFGRSWQLELAPNGRLTEALGGSVAVGGLDLYRGRMAGEPDSWLRLTRESTGHWTGLLWDGAELYAVESGRAVDDALRRPAPGNGAPVLFRLADMRLAPGALACAAGAGRDGAAPSAKADYDGLVRELAKTVESELDIAVLADAEFAARHPDPLAALATRLNNIDGIFAEQVGVTLNVTDFRVFTATDDPLTDSTDPSTLLADLGGYKSRQPDLSGLGLVHLYTGRDLDDSTAGIAYIGALCSSRFGAGLSEGRRTATTDSLIGAHEIGHNFGAPHDGEDGSVCQSTPETFLMAAQLNGSSTFSACSLEQIAPEVATALCLRNLPDADMSIAASASSATALEGTGLTLEVTATNLGTATAELVSMSIDLPTGLRLEDAGSLCTAAAGGAECTLGTVAAGSSAVAGLGLSAVSAGRTTVDVEVRADSDVQPSNNTASVPVRIDPAADLGISVGATGTLTTGASARLDLTVANASARTATDLVVRATAPSLLTPVAAQSVAADCTITGGEIRCVAPALAGGDSLAIELTVEAARDGTGTLRAEVSATEGDPDEADNTASRSIEVTSPAAGSSTGGGGGGHGLWLLLLAAGAAGAARRRP